MIMCLPFYFFSPKTIPLNEGGDAKDLLEELVKIPCRCVDLTSALKGDGTIVSALI